MRRVLRHCLLPTAYCLLLGSMLMVQARADEPDAKPAEVALSTDDAQFFETKIRPVLVDQCYECHSSKSKSLKGGLSVESRTALLSGGDSGPAVELNDPDASLLVEVLHYGDDSYQMPPKGKLPDAVVADFEQWVRRGLPDPRVVEPAATAASSDGKADEHYWSFQPVRKPAVPDTQDTTWAKTDIDRFILARLESADLRPVADADRTTLVRRLYFDLVGLPPSPAEVEAFVTDTSADAVERLVDRLMDSRQFAERWGRHWLDVARFAESSGGGRNLLFPDAWRYRDYVIDSIEGDKPFDYFVIEQVAGDLLPYETERQGREQLIASGFLVLGANNYEEQDKELLRMDVVDEQVDTVGRAFLGMTLGCARCHDHKFDPVPTADYYALAGIFRSTKTMIHDNVSSWVTRTLPGGEEAFAVFETHKNHVEQLTDDIKKSQGEIREAASGMNMDPGLPGIVVDDTQAKLAGVWSRSTTTPKFVGMGYLFNDESDKDKKSATYATSLPPGEYEVRVSYNASANRSPDASITVRHAEGETKTTIDQRRKPPIDELFISIGKFRFDSNEAAVIISSAGTTGNVIADAVQFLPLDESVMAALERPAPRADEADVRVRMVSLQENVLQMQKELKELRSHVPPAPPLAMAVVDESEVANCPIHVRGSVRNLGYEVPRGFLSVTAKAARKPLDPPEIAAGQSGRRELADWLASADNPLTSRVISNRVWHWLLGVGLVRTVDNFGSTGETPSHPELLDYLASTFVEDGWSLKKLIRRIVLSRTYQLSSEFDETAYAADPENRLLWRMNRRRLEAECLRDAMLSVSGELDLQPPGATKLVQAGDEIAEVELSFKRALYVPLLRNTPDPLFDVFDGADPNTSTGARNTSVLPTQALYLMNSDFVMDRAARAAADLLARDDLDDTARLDLLARRALGRAATPAERRLAEQYLSEAGQDSDSRRAAWTNLVQVFLACVDFRYLN